MAYTLLVGEIPKGVPEPENEFDPSALEDVRLNMIDNPQLWKDRLNEAQSAQSLGGIMPLDKIEEQMQAVDELINAYTELAQSAYPDMSIESARDFASRAYRYTQVWGENFPHNQQKIDEAKREIFSRPSENPY
jgi:hypothetical protein